MKTIKYKNMKNTNLHNALKTKNDEFYTQLEDIETELEHYTSFFENKIIYCNCDNPEFSNFWKFFHINFQKLKLKKLIATYYNSALTIGQTILLDTSLEELTDVVYEYIYDGGNDTDITVANKIPLNNDGDFQSTECIDILKTADIIVTNPPFSLFRKYIAQLIKYEKKFIVLGPMNAVSYSSIFPLIKEKKISIGYCNRESLPFVLPDGSYKKVACYWYTNLPINPPRKSLVLSETYYGNENLYPKYDNFDAIECNSIRKIPKDYYPCWYDCKISANCNYAKTEGNIKIPCDKMCNGKIGVPVTYIEYHDESLMALLGNSTDCAKPVVLSNGKHDTQKFYISNSQDINVEREREREREQSSQELLLCENHNNGLIGVPINIIQSLNTTQYEIIGNLSHGSDSIYDFAVPKLHGKELFKRILIRKIKY